MKRLIPPNFSQQQHGEMVLFFFFSFKGPFEYGVGGTLSVILVLSTMEAKAEGSQTVGQPEWHRYT